MKVQITEEMLARAIPKECSRCVIAEALIPHYPVGTYIQVSPGDHNGMVTIWEGEDLEAKPIKRQLTPAANKLANDFDEGIIVEPQEVEVWIG